MIQFNSVDEGVTDDLKSTLKQSITDNLVKIYEGTFCQEMQDTLHSQLNQLWSVLCFRDAPQLEFDLHSKDKTTISVDVTGTIILFSQAFTFNSAPKFQQEDLNEKLQKIFEELQSTQSYIQQPLQNTVKQVKSNLEEQFGVGFNVIAFTNNDQTQFACKTAFGQIENLITLPYEEGSNFSIFVFYTPLYEEEVMDQAQQDQQQEQAYMDEMNQQQQEDEQVGIVRDEYEEPMKTVFRVYEDEQQFRQSSDQLKITFDSLEINPIKLESFSLIFQFIISPFPKEIKDDLNIISTGSSLMSKNITLGINKDSLLFLNFITIHGKMETLYSQMKLKRNYLYQVVLVYHNTELYKELSLYINGTVENQVSLTQGIDVPRGIFWIGSEQALKLFRGAIRDIVFLATILNLRDVKSLYAELQTNNQQQIYKPITADIVEELLIHRQDELQNEQSTESRIVQKSRSKSKKSQIPVHLQKTHYSGFLHEDEINQSKIKKTQQMEEQQEVQPKTIQELANQLNVYLIENDVLYSKCRELSWHFYWVFTTSQLLAPPLDDGGAPKLQFDYLHYEIMKEKFDQYPVYAIELDRFVKIIHYADIQLTKEEIFSVAEVTESIRKNKEYGFYVLYDKFLLSVREAALSKEEIEMVRAQYSNDEKEEDQDLLLVSNGVHKQENQPEFTFSFFDQLVKLVGGTDEAFKFRLIYLVAYYLTNQPSVQKLTAVYIHKETEQEVEVEGVEFFNCDDDKIYSQKLDISEDVGFKYFRVQYTGKLNQMAMVSFKTYQHEETFLFDQSFKYSQEDATGYLQTYPKEDIGRLCGFSGTIVKDENGLNQLTLLHAEYLIKDPEVVKMKQQQPEQLPQVSEQWNQGKFHIVINRCSDCQSHNMTTKHDEFDFASKFNEFGEKFKDLFPNVEIIGNWDHTHQLEHFEVYVRGIGPQDRRDRQGRIFLFKKNEKLEKFLENFPKRMLRVYDEIVLIAQAYGDTIEMEKVQDHFMKTMQSTFQPRSKTSHDCPCNVPDKVEIEKKEEKGQFAGEDYICKHWGCGKPFKYEANPNGTKTCHFHPGRYEFGSKHGLWPECWTCCGQKWEEKGCKVDFHQGVPEKHFQQLCLNRGDLDKNGCPSSVCGMLFQDGDGSECKYHQGILGPNGFSCCGNPQGSEGCTVTSHSAASWPDERAKLYFVQKPIYNVAMRDNQPSMAFKDLAPKADFYRETKPYKPYVNKEREKQIKLNMTENEMRYCLNWGCEKEYKQVENKKRKACRCHPGVFDFGHTAPTVEQSVDEYSKNDKDSLILWKPHWTCCRKPWNEPGCALKQHNGPLLADYKPRKYKWPQIDAQIYFKKKVSTLWLNMLYNYYALSPEQASYEYDRHIKTIGGGGVREQQSVAIDFLSYAINLDCTYGFAVMI